MKIERRIVLFAFLFIIVITAIAGVLALLGLFSKADPQFGRWIMGVLLVEILAAVVGFLKYRPEAMFVNILFPPSIKPQKVDLDQNKCNYEKYCDDGLPRPRVSIDKIFAHCRIKILILCWLVCIKILNWVTMEIPFR